MKTALWRYIVSFLGLGQLGYTSRMAALRATMAKVMGTLAIWQILAICREKTFGLFSQVAAVSLAPETSLIASMTNVVPRTALAFGGLSWCESSAGTECKNRKYLTAEGTCESGCPTGTYPAGTGEPEKNREHVDSLSFAKRDCSDLWSKGDLGRVCMPCGANCAVCTTGASAPQKWTALDGESIQRAQEIRVTGAQTATCWERWG